MIIKWREYASIIRIIENIAKIVFVNSTTPNVLLEIFLAIEIPANSRKGTLNNLSKSEKNIIKIQCNTYYALLLLNIYSVKLF